MSLAHALIQETVRKEANRIYWDRLRAGQPGTPEGDWCLAEKRIRERTSVALFWRRVREEAYYLWQARQRYNIQSTAQQDWMVAETWVFFHHRYLLL